MWAHTEEVKNQSNKYIAVLSVVGLNTNYRVTNGLYRWC